MILSFVKGLVNLAVEPSNETEEEGASFVGDIVDTR